MKRLIALCKVEFIFTKRNLSSFILGIGLPIMLFFLISGMFSSNLNGEALKEATKQFLMSMAVYSSLSFALFTFPSMFHEDRNSGWLLTVNNLPVKMGQYYLAKVINILTVFIISIVGVFSFGKIFKGIDFTFKQWIVSGAFILFGSACILSIGLLLTLIKNQQKFIVVANIIYIIFGMIGGLWWPISNFPSTLQTIGKLLPSYHIRELSVMYITKGEIATNSIFVLLGYAIIFTVLVFIIKSKIEEK